MKKHFNLILFLTLITLLLFTYQFEELANRQKQSQLAASTQLFDPVKLGDLLQIKAPNMHLIRKKNAYFISKTNEAVESKQLNLFFANLSRIKIRRIIDKTDIKDSNIFFAKEGPSLIFNFKSDVLKFILGNKLQFDQTFYMKVISKSEPRLIVAEVTGANPSIYNKEDAHRHDGKYQKIKELFNTDNSYFLKKSKEQ